MEVRGAAASSVIRRVIGVVAGSRSRGSVFRLALGLTLAAQLLVLAPLAAADPEDQSAELIARLNEYRVAAGVPAVTSDALIAQAAWNHSTYWTLNPEPPPSSLLGFHEEESGHPGYTGRFPPERCAAVGSACSAEVMALGVIGSTAVDVLIDTVYHRQIMLSSNEVAAGGSWGSSAFTTIDLQSGSGPAPAAPVGFPVGIWSDGLAMVGEVPDPVAECNAQSTSAPIAYPVGAPITWQLPPTGEAVSVAVHRTSDGTQLDGCSDVKGWLGGYFIPAHPLDPETEYEVTLLWTPASSMPTEIAHWRFRTVASPLVPSDGGSFPPRTGPPASTTTEPATATTAAGGRVSSLRILRRGGLRTLQLKVELGQPSRVAVLLRHHGTSLARRSFPQPAGMRTLRVPLPPRGTLRGIVVMLAVLGRSGERWDFRHRL